MPDSRTVHIDVGLRRRLETRIRQMADRDLGAVEITGSIFAVTCRQAVQFQPGKVLNHNALVAGAVKEFSGFDIGLKHDMQPGQVWDLRLKGRETVPYLRRVAICWIDSRSPVQA